MKSEHLEMWYHDPLKIVRELLGNPIFKDVMQYMPIQLFMGADGKEQVFNEMWTGEWWWRIQVCILYHMNWSCLLTQSRNGFHQVLLSLRLFSPPTKHNCPSFEVTKLLGWCTSQLVISPRIHVVNCHRVMIFPYLIFSAYLIFGASFISSYLAAIRTGYPLVLYDSLFSFLTCLQRTTSEPRIQTPTRSI